MMKKLQVVGLVSALTISFSAFAEEEASSKPSEKEEKKTITLADVGKWLKSVTSFDEDKGEVKKVSQTSSKPVLMKKSASFSSGSAMATVYAARPKESALEFSGRHSYVKGSWLQTHAYGKLYNGASSGLSGYLNVLLTQGAGTTYGEKDEKAFLIQPGLRLGTDHFGGGVALSFTGLMLFDVFQTSMYIVSKEESPVAMQVMFGKGFGVKGYNFLVSSDVTNYLGAYSETALKLAYQYSQNTSFGVGLWINGSETQDDFQPFRGTVSHSF